jgi:hypothetical protein
MSTQGNTAPPAPGRWSRWTATLSSGLQGYAAWLVGISWKRFFLLSILLLIIANVLSLLPPFSWKIGESIPKAARFERDTGDFDITIDDEGIRIKRKREPAADAPPAESPKSEPAEESSLAEDAMRAPSPASRATSAGVNS